MLETHEKFRSQQELQAMQVLRSPAHAEERHSNGGTEVIQEHSYTQSRPRPSHHQEHNPSVRYVPVSLLPTPPSIQPPQPPYGDIVNKDFNDLFHQRKTVSVRPPPSNVEGSTKSSRDTVYPLGNPYSRAPPAHPHPHTHLRPPRLEGVLGPPNPRVDTTPTHRLQERGGGSGSWVPTQSYTVHTQGREIMYRQEPVIYHIADSGQLVDPRQEAGDGEIQHWEGSGEEEGEEEEEEEEEDQEEEAEDYTSISNYHNI